MLADSFPLPIRQILLYSSLLHVLLALFNYGYSIWAVDNWFLTYVRTALGDSFSSELESLHQENIGLIQVLLHYSGAYSGTLSLFGCLFRYRYSFIILGFSLMLQVTYVRYRTLPDTITLDRNTSTALRRRGSD